MRVIAADGSMLGVLGTHEALRLAQEQGLDLVEVNPKADPPVCKILDFGKYKYEEKKKAGEAKRKQTVVEIKEIKLRPKTDDHDLAFKVTRGAPLPRGRSQGEVHRALPRPRDHAPREGARAARLRRPGDRGHRERRDARR